MSKKTSQARIEANRRNGRNSTGPRTAEGKARSSQNAITHGLFSESGSPNPSTLVAVNGPVTHGAHMALLIAFTGNFHPVGNLEIALVARLASLQHRLHRITTIESGAFDNAMTSILKYNPEYAAPGQTTFDDCLAASSPTLLAEAYGRTSKYLNLLSFYEARLSRDFHRTLTELRHTQYLRQQALLQEAEANLETNRMALPTNDQPSAPALAETAVAESPQPENGKTNPIPAQINESITTYAVAPSASKEPATMLNATFVDPASTRAEGQPSCS